MKKKIIVGSIAAALTLASSVAFAGTEHEKCKVVDKDGKGLIKAGKADCAGSGNSCAGTNKAGDPNAWIMVPKGKCADINQGNFADLPDSIKDKIEQAAPAEAHADEGHGGA